SASFEVAIAACAPPIEVARGRSTDTGQGAPGSVALFCARAAKAHARTTSGIARITEERALPATGGAPLARSIGEERALPATGGAPLARSIGEERALPATGGAPLARSIGEERALPATRGARRR